MNLTIKTPASKIFIINDNKFKITKFQTWLLKQIAKRIVIQSCNHEDNIVKYYQIIADASRKEFREDNLPTLNSFLTNCFNKTLFKY